MRAEPDDSIDPPASTPEPVRSLSDRLLARGGHPERVKNIYDLGVTAAISNTTAAVLMWLVLRDAVPTGALTIWLAFILTKSYYYYDARARSTSLKLTRISDRTRRLMTRFAGFAGLIWAPAPLATSLYLEGYTQTLGLALTLILLLGGVVVYAVIPILAVTFMACALAPVVVYHLSLLTVDGLVFASTMLLLMAVMTLFSMKFGDIVAAGEARADQRKRAMEMLRAAHTDIKRLADRDPVTGLFNRRALITQLENAIAAGKTAPPGRNYALYVIDLDHFKHINDTYGHDRGDQYLVKVAQRLLGAVRSDATVARLGGDEFAIVTTRGLTDAEIQDFGQSLICCLSGTIHVAGSDLRVGASIGVATTPSDCETVREWLSFADQCLIAAKATQRGTLRQFSLSDRARLHHRKTMASALERAMVSHSIRAAYQPQINLLTREICAVEALARWTDQTGQPIPPPQMFALAESSGSVLELCDAIYHRIAQDLTQLNLAQQAPIQLSVNLHQAQLYHPERLTEQLSWLSDAMGGPHRITLEITENSIVKRGAEEVPTLLGALAHEGFRISLDDFGTGYASLTHIRDLPLHEVKIDRSFVTHLATTPEDQEIVRSVLAIGHARGLCVVAEGIETSEQLSILRDLGCTIGQGYFFAKPLPSAELLTHLPHAQKARMS